MAHEYDSGKGGQVMSEGGDDTCLMLEFGEVASRLGVADRWVWRNSLGPGFPLTRIKLWPRKTRFCSCEVAGLGEKMGVEGEWVMCEGVACKRPCGKHHDE